MPDIVHQFQINAPASRVFEAVSTPSGLESWWTVRSTGQPRTGGDYGLCFGPGYDWRARVTRFVPDQEFELTVTDGDSDWLGTCIGFRLTESNSGTEVLFRHSGWPKANGHYNVSCFCWAMYLRLMKRFVELGEVVPYERRLDV
jgi:uncharacterized protein YndB with AHSA1/START domain